MKMIDYELALSECKKPSIYDLSDTPEFLSNLPILDASPVVFCEFSGRFRGDDTLHCSNCRESFNSHYNEVDRFNFCPICGAKIIEKWTSDFITNSGD